MQSYISGNGPKLWAPQSAIEDATIQQIETAILEDRRVTERQLVRELKNSLVSVVKIMYDEYVKGVCLMDSTVPHNFSRSKNGPRPLKLFRPYIKTIRRTFVKD